MSRAGFLALALCQTGPVFSSHGATREPRVLLNIMRSAVQVTSICRENIGVDAIERSRRLGGFELILTTAVTPLVETGAGPATTCVFRGGGRRLLFFVL